MKKIVLILACAVSLTVAKAQQKTIQWGAGLNIGVPVGDFSQTHSFGIGFEGQAEYPIATQASLVGSLGFTNFFGKKDDYYDYKYKSAGIIPILVGARFYPTEQFFVGGKLGYGIFTGEGGGGAFNFVPQVGYNAPQYQVSLGFHLLSRDGGNASYLGLTGIYKFQTK